MAATATINLNITVFGNGRDFSDVVEASNDNSPLQVMPGYAFATGFQSLTVPANAIALQITNITGTLSVCGSSGDTGRALNNANGVPALLPVTGGGTIDFIASAGAKADI